MAVFTETVKFDDQVSAPAKVAAGALNAGADAALNFGQRMAAIRAAKKPLADVASGTVASSKALTSLGNTAGGSLTPVSNGLSSMGQKAFDASNAMKVGKETISAAFGDIANSAKALASGDVKGAVTGLVDSIADMSKLLDLAVPGLGQAVSAVLKIAGGLAGITAGLIQSGIEFAITSSEAKQQMLGLFDAMGEGNITGAQTEDMIDALKAKTGIAKDSLIEYTKALEQMGQTDLSQLNDSLLATASAAALVKNGDQAFLSLTKKIQTFVQTGQGLKLPIKGLGSLADVGLTVDDVAKKLGVSATSLAASLKAGTQDAGKFGDALQEAIIDKGAGPLAKFSASSANLKKLLSESIGDLFEDIDVGPFLAQIKSLFDIFGQGKSSGQALKAGIGGFFTEVLAVATKVVPLVKHFLLDLVIYGLKAYIALKPIVKTFYDMITSATGMAIIKAILTGLVVAFVAVAAVIAVVVLAVGALWAAGMLLGLAIWAVIGAVIYFGVQLGSAIADGVGAAMAWLGELMGGIVAIGESIWAALTGWVTNAGTAASNFVQGLVQGIVAGGSAVVSAVTGLASGAVSAFKGALGIHSPSTVMAQMGEHMTDGAVDGIEGGTADVKAATTSMAGAAVKGAGDAGSASGGRAGAQITVQVLIDGSGKSAMEITEEMVAQVFARMALEAGV